MDLILIVEDTIEFNDIRMIQVGLYLDFFYKGTL